MADLDVSGSESSDIDAGDGGFEEDLDGETAGEPLDIAGENYSSDVEQLRMISLDFKTIVCWMKRIFSVVMAAYVQ